MSRPSRRVGVLTAVVAVAAIGVAMGATPQTSPPPPPPPSQSAATTSPAAGTGLIVGRAVDAADGSPIANAVVTLNNRNSNGVIPPVFVMTAADGRFVFTSVPPGSYTFLVTKSGYSGSTSHVLDLHDHEPVTDLILKMRRPARITGTITDESGEALVGVSVQLLRAGPYVPLHGITATTDDRGAYRLSAAAGSYFVAVFSTRTTLPIDVVQAVSRDPRLLMSVANFTAPPGSDSNQLIGDVLLQDLQRSAIPPPVAPGEPLEVYPTTFYPGATTATAATKVIVKAGEWRTGADISLKPVRSCRVAGTVVGRDGPVAHAVLRLSPAAADDPMSVFLWSATALSDARGSFAMLGVPAGQYVLSVSADQTPPAATASPESSAARNSGLLSDVEPLTIGNADVTDLAITLHEPVTLRGRLQFDGTAPKPTPERLKSPIVMLVVPGGFNAAWSDTAFNLTATVTPGHYRVQSLFFSPWWLAAATLDGHDVLDSGFDVRNEDVSGLVVVYTDHPTTISGTVRTSAGAPDGEALVLAFPVDPTRWTDMDGPRFASAPTTHAGAFSFRALPPGDYFIVAVSDDDLDEWKDAKILETLSRIATRVQVADGATKTVDLRTEKIQ